MNDTPSKIGRRGGYSGGKSAADMRPPMRLRTTTRSTDPDASRETQDERWHGYIAVRPDGLVTLPAALRHRLTPGTRLELTERPDGVLELKPVAEE